MKNNNKIIYDIETRKLTIPALEDKSCIGVYERNKMFGLLIEELFSHIRNWSDSPEFMEHSSPLTMSSNELTNPPAEKLAAILAGTPLLAIVNLWAITINGAMNKNSKVFLDIGELLAKYVPKENTTKDKATDPNPNLN